MAKKKEEPEVSIAEEETEVTESEPVVETPVIEKPVPDAPRVTEDKFSVMSGTSIKNMDVPEDWKEMLVQKGMEQFYNLPLGTMRKSILVGVRANTSEPKEFTLLHYDPSTLSKAWTFYSSNVQNPNPKVFLRMFIEKAKLSTNAYPKLSIVNLE